MKQNCWEYMRCERQPGGSKEQQLGTCPVATYVYLDGVHGGKNAGRACWVVAGSLCGGRKQGNEEQKRNACWECAFLNIVRREEEAEAFGFSHTRLGMDRVILKSSRP